MRSIKPMRTAKIGYIVMSAVLSLFGILLIVKPDFSVSMIGTITGIVLIIFGGFKLVGYFSKDLYRLAFQYDLAFGVLMIILGVIVLLKPDNVMNFLCIVLGISILTDGLFKIQISVDSRRFGIRLWWLILVLAVLTGVVGVLLVFRPTESARTLTVLLGISLLFEGLLSLSTALTAVKIIRHQQPDVIEADYDEE